MSLDQIVSIDADQLLLVIPTLLCGSSEDDFHVPFLVLLLCGAINTNQLFDDKQRAFT